MYKEISDYGLIGNMLTSALVGTDGSIDWFCAPNFDSPSIFGAILDSKKGGYYRIHADHTLRTNQFYYPDTNILITRFITSDGIGEVIDFMPINEDGSPLKDNPTTIIRSIKCITGNIRFLIQCFPAFQYATVPPKIAVGTHEVVLHTDQESISLCTNHIKNFKVSDEGIEASIELRSGEAERTVMRYYPQVISLNSKKRLQPRKLFATTRRFWHEWLLKCTYNGLWKEHVHRSALVLKLLCYSKTGAMVAAPTTSLPETLGGTRNWDYRYSWVRDASFSLHGLMRIGFKDEARIFIEWLLNEVIIPSRDTGLQVLYDIHGNSHPPEIELSHLAGYKNSGPVRIGNGASKQLQLDIYGEFVDAVYTYNKSGHRISYQWWNEISRMLDWLLDNWHKPDMSIWEVRNEEQHFVFSKVMCWVAFDRGLRLAQDRGFPANVNKWRSARDSIYREVMEKGWNEELGAFVQSYGSQFLDASHLTLALCNFLAPKDPRNLSTINSIMANLSADSLVYRYLSADGINEEEGTFVMCSFWLVEALAAADRVGEARLIFEKMLSYSNHLRLFSEEISMHGELLGNFPQAFSHFALINSAYVLNEKINENGQVHHEDEL